MITKIKFKFGGSMKKTYFLFIIFSFSNFIFADDFSRYFDAVKGKNIVFIRGLSDGPAEEIYQIISQTGLNISLNLEPSVKYRTKNSLIQVAFEPKGYKVSFTDGTIWKKHSKLVLTDSKENSKVKLKVYGTIAQTLFNSIESLKKVDKLKLKYTFCHSNSDRSARFYYQCEIHGE